MSEPQTPQPLLPSSTIPSPQEQAYFVSIGRKLGRFFAILHSPGVVASRLASCIPLASCVAAGKLCATVAAVY